MSLKFKWFYEIKRLYLLLSLFVVGCSINNSSTNSDNIASSSPISLSNVTNWTDYLKNRYYNCYYEVNGIISKINNIELKYENLKNITDTPSNFDYSSITENKQSLSEVEEEFNNITLNNKLNGVGKIVTFEGTIIATDRSDANQKVVVYDGEKVLTIIDNKKICESNSIGNKYIFTGSLSVLHGSPAIWLLSSSYVSKTNLELNNYKEVVPSYFKKWYYLSNNQNAPAYNEFFTLFKVTGYVKYNTDFTTKYDLGLVDDENGTLSDQNITRSIDGIFLMNNLSLNKQNEINNSIFFEHLNKKVTVYVTLHQFETNNHGWKVFPVDSTLNVIE